MLAASCSFARMEQTRKMTRAKEPLAPPQHTGTRFPPAVLCKSVVFIPLMFQATILPGPQEVLGEYVFHKKDIHNAHGICKLFLFVFKFSGVLLNLFNGAFMGRKFSHQLYMKILSGKKMSNKFIFV